MATPKLYFLEQPGEQFRWVLYTRKSNIEFSEFFPTRILVVEDALENLQEELMDEDLEINALVDAIPTYIRQAVKTRLLETHHVELTGEFRDDQNDSEHA